MHNLCPGFTDTAMVIPTEEVVGHGDRNAARRLLENSVPLGRYADPIETAVLVAWLLSEESSYSTGGYFTVDGGVDAAAVGFVPPEG
jgi:NAD(P)-dependent dehydrogenase (short-subunit alcohol dehydrogenase family)